MAKSKESMNGEAKVMNGEIKESIFSSDIIRPLIVRQKKARDNAHLNRFAEAYLGGEHCAIWPPFLTLPFSKKEQN